MATTKTSRNISPRAIWSPQTTEFVTESLTAPFRFIVLLNVFTSLLDRLEYISGIELRQLHTVIKLIMLIEQCGFAAALLDVHKFSRLPLPCRLSQSLCV